MIFWYLGSGYSLHPRGLEAAAAEACRAAGDLMRAGVKVFCPIAHSHAISMHGGIDPLSHEIWMPADEPFMHAAHGLIVLKGDGWEQSRGLRQEIGTFQMADKPIVFMAPGIVPKEVLP
jgi:hypothetical protein